ncbi:Glycosyltransferase involved in cell wall bisynthesis [Pricia antarctica]|uniref:Glycosyltransferase involved in cell wall bisynthesis n=1 Tax=Pricia antarctica TaxID=641691 RepID=A0A1G7I726_9FLAO|nr:glycosyltransferase [Pricia antarctica]SDF08264.1 Glycosyltransferase involved in cell wall bisynthesis [Pricia antarctica]
MKIAIIAHCLHPIREPFEGGLEMITFLLCRSLMERGHKVHLFGHRDSHESFHIKAIPTDKLYPSAFFSEMSAMGQDAVAVRELLAYTHVMQQIAEGDYDLVHNHSLHYMPILMGNSLGIPMVTSIHTPTFPYLQLGANGVKGNERQTFTMVSKSLANTWNKMIPSATVVYNGIDLSHWEPVREPSCDYVLWYGRICPEKGTDLAIKAALRARIPIILAGPVSNRDYFNTRVAPLLEEAGVTYIGHIEQKKLGPWLANASALLFTSTWEEPYGLTLAESLACGTPVVAFEGGATREILTDACGIIVPKHDSEAMASAIHTIPKLNRSDCRKRAENFCSHELMVEGYLNIYNRLLEQKEYITYRVP